MPAGSAVMLTPECRLHPLFLPHPAPCGGALAPAAIVESLTLKSVKTSSKNHCPNESGFAPWHFPKCKAVGDRTLDVASGIQPRKPSLVACTMSPPQRSPPQLLCLSTPFPLFFLLIQRARLSPSLVSPPPLPLESSPGFPATSLPFLSGWARSPPPPPPRPSSPRRVQLLAFPAPSHPGLGSPSPVAPVRISLLPDPGTSPSRSGGGGGWPRLPSAA
ncbi:uncharacterized protein LOC125919782 [Panthera uncia]|uniref:uncharacterized protein LOC125919782 n=1 Tax=Panthera uncia TaxID=29064 RepID=UPI0020FFC388|nr:uncharacterized protein LOC125919782 [Panthera uncia]